jgi:hypothetical protein
MEVKLINFTYPLSPRPRILGDNHLRFTDTFNASNRPAYPAVGSQTEGIKMNDDGSFDIYFGPKPPDGFENNWLQTIPGKSWFVAFRIYGPLEPWIEKTWRPGEVTLVEE